MVIKFYKVIYRTEQESCHYSETYLDECMSHICNTYKEAQKDAREESWQFADCLVEFYRAKLTKKEIEENGGYESEDLQMYIEDNFLQWRENYYNGRIVPVESFYINKKKSIDIYRWDGKTRNELHPKYRKKNLKKTK